MNDITMCCCVSSRRQNVSTGTKCCVFLIRCEPLWLLSLCCSVDSTRVFFEASRTKPSKHLDVESCNARRSQSVAIINVGRIPWSKFGVFPFCMGIQALKSESAKGRAPKFQIRSACIGRAAVTEVAGCALFTPNSCWALSYR